MGKVISQDSRLFRSLLAYGPTEIRSGRVCSVWQWVGLAAFVMTTLGCGGSAHELDTATVSGSVTLDGQPLAAGYVTIVTKKGRMAKGAIEPDGTFVVGTYEKADGAQVGTHAVVVTPVPADEAGGAQITMPIPEKYTRASTSGLTIIVKPGEDNILKLALSSEN